MSSLFFPTNEEEVPETVPETIPETVPATVPATVQAIVEGQEGQNENIDIAPETSENSIETETTSGASTFVSNPDEVEEPPIVESTEEEEEEELVEEASEFSIEIPEEGTETIPGDLSISPPSDAEDEKTIDETVEKAGSPNVLESSSMNESAGKSVLIHSTHKNKDEICVKGPHLHCKNGGTCRVGERPDDLYDSLDSVTSAWLQKHLETVDLSQDGGMYCDCAEGFTGPYCETPIVICGENEHLCLAGGACIENNLDETDEHYYCMCKKYSNEPVRVGKMCEFVADISCELHDKYSDHSYCTNGGKCIDTIQDRMSRHAGCECPEGFRGRHCEVVVGLQFDKGPVVEEKPNPPKENLGVSIFSHSTHKDYGDACVKGPSLHCKNGGTCKVGERPDDLYDSLDSVTSAWLQKHLETVDLSQDGGMYCECAEGFTGPYCETPIVICGENEHLCLAGGACIENNLDETDEHYYCMCKKYSNEPVRVGKMCEFVADISCELHDKYSDHSYCTNGGKCIDTIQDRMSRHAGCECPDGFRGRHCEVVVGLQFDNGDNSVLFNGVSTESDASSGMSSSLKFFAVTMGTLAIVILPIFMMVFRRSNSRKYKNPDMNTGIELVQEPYRDNVAYSDKEDSTVTKRTSSRAGKEEKNIV